MLTVSQSRRGTPQTRFLRGAQNRVRAMTLIELLVSMGIFVFLMAAVVAVLTISQSSWRQADRQIGLQENVRKARMRLTRELAESGFDAAEPTPNCMVAISDNAGVNGSDIIRFSIPVDHDNDGDVLDVNGDIEWGAPLLWADKNPDCEGPGDNCDYLGYEIEYLINADNQFVRQVFDSGGVLINEAVYAERITNFQVSRSGALVTVELTAETTAFLGRPLVYRLLWDVYLRNRG